MIYVTFGKSYKLNNSMESCFLFFDYDVRVLEIVKSLPVRAWVPENKCWEIPYKDLPKLQRLYAPIIINNPQYHEQNKHADNTAVNVLDMEFKTKPMQHQLQALQYSLENPSFLLGDEQGLGKTKQVIDISNIRKQFNDVKHVLIICGVNSLQYNWLNEIKVHSDLNGVILGSRVNRKGRLVIDGTQAKIDHLKSVPSEFFWIVNVEALRGKNISKKGAKRKTYSYEFVDVVNELVESGELGLIAIDEVHKLKNPNSNQGRAVLKIKNVPIIPMSGTFVVNSPLDMYMPLSLVGMASSSYWSFKNRYTVSDFWGGVVGYQNMDELRETIDSVMVRRKKEDVLDLPEKLPTKIEYVELSSLEWKMYMEIWQSTLKEVNEIKNPTTVLAKITRLRQVVNHTALVSSKHSKSTKFDRLDDILQEAKLNGRKVLVFSMFKELLYLAEEHFKEYEPMFVHGDYSGEQINTNINNFQNEDGFKVMFGQINVMGTGFTLNTASIVVFLDLPWNMATMDQAIDRAHRIGTKQPVTVIALLAKDTYDEIVWNTVFSKGVISDNLVDGKDIGAYKRVLNILFEGGQYE